jgi:dTMP kinase
MKRGHLIVLEGIDGTGKSTQTKRLGVWMESLGHTVVLSREPTDGPYGSKLRASAATGRLSIQEELGLFLKDRRDHVETLIAPNLADGRSVILDRYYFSTMAYQGARGLDPVEIRHTNEAFAPQPDLLLILDIDVDVSHQRIGLRGDAVNEFEQEETLERCREIFLALKDEPFARVIDASRTLDEVSQSIREEVSRFLARVERNETSTEP